MIENTTDTSGLLSLIFDSVSKASHARTLSRLMFVLADMGRDMIYAERCSIWLWDKEHHELITYVAHGVEGIHIPDDTGVVGAAIKNDEEIIINDPYNDPRFNSKVDKDTHFVTKSMIVMPIKDGHHEIIGAFQALNKQNNEGKFDERDAKYLRLAASYAGNAMGSAMMTEEVEKTQREIVALLADLGESRSLETGKHVQRVVEYSALIAQELGLSPKEVDLLRIASPLHDIGKVAIPDNILNKPASLSQTEFAIMKSHTTVGYNLLAGSKRPLLKAAAVISHEHHERHDGKGYPRGISGDDIHIFARITSVADVFDALSSPRCYKPALPLDRTLEIIKEGRGTQFTPEVVDAFFNCLPQILELQAELGADEGEIVI